MIQVCLNVKTSHINIHSLLFFTTLLVSVFCQNIAFADETLPDLKIDKLEDDIYLHTSFKQYDGFGLVASNGLVVIDNKNAFIIDTPTSAQDTKKLVNWFEVRGFTVKGSLSTHFHDDSTAGIEWLNSHFIPTYASKLTNKLLGAASKPQAKKSFDGTHFWLLKDKIEVFYPGAGHTVDNVVVWIPKQKVLFGGCFVKVKHIGNVNDAVIEAWPDSAQKLISRYGMAAMVVPGHGKVGGASLLDSTKKLTLKAQR